MIRTFLKIFLCNFTFWSKVQRHEIKPTWNFLYLKKFFIVIKLVFFLRLFKTRVCAKCLSCRVAKNTSKFERKVWTEKKLAKCLFSINTKIVYLLRFASSKKGQTFLQPSYLYAFTKYTSYSLRDVYILRYKTTEAYIKTLKKLRNNKNNRDEIIIIALGNFKQS